MYSNLDLDTSICKVMSISSADCSKADKLNYVYPGGSRPRPVSHNTGRVFLYILMANEFLPFALKAGVPILMSIPKCFHII